MKRVYVYYSMEEDNEKYYWIISLNSSFKVIIAASGGYFVNVDSAKRNFKTFAKNLNLKWEEVKD